MSIARCANCGKYVHEDVALEYNDRFYCGIRCKLTQERKDDAALCNPSPRVVYIER